MERVSLYINIKYPIKKLYSPFSIHHSSLSGGNEYVTTSTGFGRGRDILSRSGHVSKDGYEVLANVGTVYSTTVDLQEITLRNPKSRVLFSC